jgi:hypothetical protein
MSKKTTEKNLAQAGGLDWLATAADSRGNLIRIVGIASFYSIHLLNVWLPKLAAGSLSEMIGLGVTPVPKNVHVAVSLVVAAWLMQAFGIYAATAAGHASRRMAMLVAIGDVCWLSAALSLSTGAQGPLVVGYFLIIAMAALRLDLLIVRWTTAASVVGYLAVLAACRWPMGILKEIAPPSVPRYHQLMMIVALVLAGVVIGQVVRLGWAVFSTRKELNGEESHE